MMSDLNMTLVSQMVLTLEGFDIVVFMSLRLREAFTGPRLSKESIAFAPALDAGLIAEDGSYHCREELRAALDLLWRHRQR